MTTYEYATDEVRSQAQPRVVPRSLGKIVVSWLTTTDHKVLGYMYLITSFVFFCIGGVMALMIRAELFEPGMQILQTKEQYNQLFTMHGTVMLLMFGTPLFIGLANVLVPLQMGVLQFPLPSARRCFKLGQALRRAIESYTEQRQLHAELDDYADTLVFNSLIESSAGRRSAPPAH